MHKYIVLFSVLATSLLAGCTTQQCQVPCHARGHVRQTSTLSVVNNTPYRLGVHQDGAHLCDLQPGQQCQLDRSFFRVYSTATVFAYENDRYVGAESYIFNNAVADVWQVNEVTKAHP